MSDPVPFGERRAAWLHRLPPAELAMLHDARRAARAAHPVEQNALAAAWDAGEISGKVAAMPREFVVSLDRGP